MSTLSATSDQVAHERALQLAENDVAEIEKLLDPASPFQKYFVRRLKEEREKIRERLADDENLTGRETRALRRVVKEYDAIINLPVTDRAAHYSTIEAKRRAGGRQGPSRG